MCEQQGQKFDALSMRQQHFAPWQRDGWLSDWPELGASGNHLRWHGPTMAGLYLSRGKWITGPSCGTEPVNCSADQNSWPHDDPDEGRVKVSVKCERLVANRSSRQVHPDDFKGPRSSLRFFVRQGCSRLSCWLFLNDRSWLRTHRRLKKIKTDWLYHHKPSSNMDSRLSRHDFHCTWAVVPEQIYDLPPAAHAEALVQLHGRIREAWNWLVSFCIIHGFLCDLCIIIKFHHVISMLWFWLENSQEIM